MTRKWAGNPGGIKLVLRIGTSQSHMSRKECVQKQAKGMERLCQKPSANFSLHLSDHLCVRCRFMNQSLSLELGGEACELRERKMDTWEKKEKKTHAL